METESESCTKRQSTTRCASVENGLERLSELNQRHCDESSLGSSNSQTAAGTDERESPEGEEPSSPVDSVGFSETSLQGYSLETYLSDFGSSSSSGGDLGSISQSCMERLIGTLESPSFDTGKKVHLTREEELEVGEDDRCPSLFQASLMASTLASSLIGPTVGLTPRPECCEKEKSRAEVVSETKGEATVTLANGRGCGEADESLPVNLSLLCNASAAKGGESDIHGTENAKVDTLSRTLDYGADDEDPDRCPSTFYVSSDLPESLREDLCVTSMDARASQATERQAEKFPCTALSMGDPSYNDNGSSPLVHSQGECQSKSADGDKHLQTLAGTEHLAPLHLPQNTSMNESSVPTGKSTLQSSTDKEESFKEDQSSTEENIYTAEHVQPEYGEKLQLAECLGGPALSCSPDSLPSVSSAGPSQILSKEHLEVLQLFGLSESSSAKVDSLDSDIDLLSLSQNNSLGALQQGESDIVDQTLPQPSPHSVPSVSESCKDCTHHTLKMDSQRPNSSAGYVEEGYRFNIEDPDLMKELDDSESSMSVDSPCHSPAPDSHVPVDPTNGEEGDDKETSAESCVAQSFEANSFRREDGAMEKEPFSTDSFEIVTDFSLLSLPAKISAGESQVRAVQVLSNHAQDKETNEGNMPISSAVNGSAVTDIKGLCPCSQAVSVADPERLSTESDNNTAFRPVAAPRKGVSAVPVGSFSVDQSGTKEPMTGTPCLSQQQGLPESQRALLNQSRADTDAQQKQDTEIRRPFLQDQGHENYPSELNSTHTTPAMMIPAQSTSKYSKNDPRFQPGNRTSGAPFIPAQPAPEKDQAYPAFTGCNTGKEMSVPQSLNSQVLESNQAGVTVLMQQTRGRAALTPARDQFAELVGATETQALRMYQDNRPAQGNSSPLSVQHVTRQASPEQWAHQELGSASQQKDLKLAEQQVKNHRQKDAHEDLPKSVIVTGASLEKDDEEICKYYFENKRRSGGGEIEEGGLWWDEERNCFIITFVDGQVAKSVADREHTLKGRPVQVEVCASPPQPRAHTAATPPQSTERRSQPPATAKTAPLSAQTKTPTGPSTGVASAYRVKVSGVPSGTSADCLQNYLECVADVSVSSISLSKGGASAVVTMDYSEDEPDLHSMASVCRETPLEEGKNMSFHEVSPSHTVHVTGLKSSTADDAVQFFFSNKRRNNGGPVEKVERSANKTSALVLFKDPKDAEAVAMKENHTLDGSKLIVTLCEEGGDDDDEKSEDNEEESFADREPYRKPEPSSDDECAADQEGQSAHLGERGLASRDGQYAREKQGYSMSDRQHVPAASDYTSAPSKNTPYYSSSASAEMKPREGYDEMRRDSSRHTDGYSQHKESRYQENSNYTGKRHTDNYGETGGRASSDIINSFQSPRKVKNEFKGEERAGSTQHSSGNNRGSFEQGDLRPPAPSSAKTSPEARRTDQEFHTMIKLGARAMRRITDNHVLLRELTTKMRAVGARFRWKQPDHMLVKCTLPEPTSEWERAVHDKVNSFLSLLAQHERLAAERNEKPATDDSRNQPQKTDSNTWRSNDGGSDDDDDDTPEEHHSFSKSAKPPTDTPLSAMREDDIPNLKPYQLKVLSIPSALDRFRKGYPGLKVNVDQERKIAKVAAPEDEMKKAFSDLLAFVTSLRELKLSLTPGLLKMFEQEDTKDWIKKTLIDEHGFVCHWVVADEHIILSGQSSELSRIQQMFEEAFKEKKVKLEPQEACVLKSPAWKAFVEDLRGSNSCPRPVLLPSGDSVTIVDTPSSITNRELRLRQFLSKNKQEEKTLDVSPNKIKFLKQTCEHDVKDLSEKAKEVGVTVRFNEKGLQVQGPKDSLPNVIGEANEMIARIKEDKMTFKKPGMAKYLTGPKGKDFLAQTGPLTKCYITTGKEGDSGAAATGSSSRVLANVKVSPNLKLQIIQGDITQCPVDAIVNAANKRLSHDGGVAAAIVKAGGKCIQEESDELVAEHGHVEVGEVAVTGAGILPCTHVIHAVGPIWSSGTKDEDKLLKKTVKSILEEAEKMELTSVAIPAISCGIFGYPVDQATSLILGTIGQFFMKGESGHSLQKVLLVDMGAKALQGFLTAAKHLFGKNVELKESPKSAPPSRKHEGSSQKSADRDSGRSHSDRGHDETSDGPIKIIPGEIAKSKADVIVCTTHPSLDLHKGVLSKSILSEGGDDIQQELKKYHGRYGQPELGHIVRTSGGKLRCKLVFHLSLPSWRDDHGQKMKSAVKACLDEASKKKARSIAFPTLGTGRLGYPSDKVASLMQSAIHKWFSDNRHSSVKEVQIIVFPKDRETLQAFKDGGSHDEGHSSGRGHGHRGSRGGDADTSGGPSSCKVKVGKITVMVKEGDILAEPCDAIVNSSNDSLDLTKGVVSKAILKACGQDILLECTQQKDEMGENGVAITRAEGLACGHVIHVSADRFKRNWTEGILEVLRLADEEGISSLAMPALGTGGRGANPDELAQAMHEAVSKFSRRSQSVKEVLVVVFQKQLLRPYISAFDPDAARASPRERERSDSAGGASAAGGDKRQQAQAVDVFIYSLQQSAVKEAREKIHRHMTGIFTSKTETNPVIASFNARQKEEMFKLQRKHNIDISLDDKKGAVTFTGIDIDVTRAVSDLKDIILSATTQRHLAAGGPPVRWQYQTGKDKFADFDPETTLTIEAAFKKKEHSVHFSDKKGRGYKIVFKDRKEYSLDDSKAHPVTVKRRDILEEKKQDIPLPDHWEPMKGDKVKQVQLKPNSSEYKRVAGHFSRQGQGNIKKIERIQNPSLFQQYKIKKRELEQYNPKGTENEKRLFHGTSSDSIKSIITNGFNRSYCGKNGTALGNGVYFAADSATSMGYAQGGQMFQARVLVGEYTPGNSSMRMPPKKPNADRPYDSVSNGPPPNGSVFVIFHDSQAYPEYLITFR